MPTVQQLAVAPRWLLLSRLPAWEESEGAYATREGRGEIVKNKMLFLGYLLLLLILFACFVGMVVMAILLTCAGDLGTAWIGIVGALVVYIILKGITEDLL